MPSVAMKIETESSTSLSQMSLDSANPVKQIAIFLEKKVRNLEKRKQKLNTLMDEQKRGKTLEKDQLEAIEHLPEVEYQVEFAKDFMKCINQITQEAAKCSKQVRKAEQRERSQAEQRKLRDFMKFQDLLNCFGIEETRQHFIDGTSGAMKLDETNLGQLDSLYNLLAPNREAVVTAGGSWSAALEEASGHANALVSGLAKPIVGMEGDVTYKEMHTLLLSVADSGYFEPSRTCSPSPADENQESGSSSVSGDDRGFDSTSSQVAKSVGDNSHQNSLEPSSDPQGIDAGMHSSTGAGVTQTTTGVSDATTDHDLAGSTAAMSGVMLNGTGGSRSTDSGAVGAMRSSGCRVARISTSSGGAGAQLEDGGVPIGLSDGQQAMGFQQQAQHHGASQVVPSSGFAGIQMVATGVADMNMGGVPSAGGLGGPAPLPQRSTQPGSDGHDHLNSAVQVGANPPISDMFLQDEQHELTGSVQPGLDAAAASSVPFYPMSHFSGNIQQNQFAHSSASSFGGAASSVPDVPSNVIPDQSHSFQSAQSAALYAHDAALAGMKPVVTGQGMASESVTINMPLSPQEASVGAHHQPSGSPMVEEPSQYQQQHIHHQQQQQANQRSQQLQHQQPAQSQIQTAPRGWGTINQPQPQQPAVDPTQPNKGEANMAGRVNKQAGMESGGFNNGGSGGYYPQQERGGYRGGNRGGGGGGYRGNGGGTYYRGGRGGPRGGAGSGGYGGPQGNRGGRGGTSSDGYYGGRGGPRTGPVRGAPRGGYQSGGTRGSGNWRGGSGVPAQ